MKNIGLSLAAAGTLFFAAYGLAAARPQAASVSVKPGEDKPKPPALDVAACQTCHESSLSKGFLKSYHAGLEGSCASCHKTAAEHSEGMQAGADNVPVPSVTKLKSA